MRGESHKELNHINLPDGLSEEELLQEIGGDWDIDYDHFDPDICAWQLELEAKAHALKHAQHVQREALQSLASEEKSSEHSNGSPESDPTSSSRAVSAEALTGVASEPFLCAQSKPHPPYHARAASHGGANSFSAGKSPFSLPSFPSGEVAFPVSLSRTATLPERPRSEGCPPLQHPNMAMHNIKGLSEEVGAVVSAGEIPNEMLPSILERVTRKGKGGRQPAADPRTLPGVDPKKAKRIIANRESAARSKLKQKVLMETLKTRQDMLVTQRMTAQEELELLRRMCRDLQAKNAQLESRVKVLESSRAQSINPKGMDMDEDPCASGSGQPARGEGQRSELSLDDQMLAGISTLASMAAQGAGRQGGQGGSGGGAGPSGSVPAPSLWTPPMPASHETLDAASSTAILEALHAQHLQQQQQQHQRPSVVGGSKPQARALSQLSRPQAQLLQQNKVQSPFFGSLNPAFAAPSGSASIPFGAPGWTFPSPSGTPTTSQPHSSIIKPVPMHASGPSAPAGTPPLHPSGSVEIGGVVGSGGEGERSSGGRAWAAPSPHLATPALRAHPIRRDAHTME